MTSPKHFSHSKRISLSVLEKALERDRYLIEKALQILSVEDPESTYTELSAVSGLLNHWLVNGELGYYINGQRGDDFLALTVIPVNGDYGRGLAALETWITIDKEDLVGLLRSRNLIVPANLLNTKADRMPNWDKWRLMPNPALWQCVALSLNIDPDKVDIDRNSWMVGDNVFKESREFEDRIDIALANLSSNGPLYPNTYRPFRSSTTVSLRQFASWVRQIEWSVPPELLALADPQCPTIDWNYWTALDLWPIDAACKIVCGCSPNEPTRHAEIDNPYTSTRPAWVNVYHQAMSAIKAGNLSVVDSEVTAAEFIAWAQGKGIPISAELSQFALCLATTKEAIAKAEGAGKRGQCKQETEARRREWQEEINMLARKHPDYSHANLCRVLAKKVDATFQTIRRQTRVRHG